MSRSIRTSAVARRRAASAARIAAVVAAVLSAAPPARAHGFGQRYDLQLPLSLYLFAAAAAVALSLVVVGLFLRQAPPSRRRPAIDLLSSPPGRWFAHPGIVLPLRILALGVFILTVAAGFYGSQNPYANIAPTLVWVVGWIGFAYVSAFIGNLWAPINPWRTLFDGMAWAVRRITGRSDHPPPWTYPEALGVLPASLLLLAFSWIELVYPDAAVPAQIAWLAVLYSMATLAGMALFGEETWLRRGEMFSVVFATFARFAPTQMEVRDPAVCARCDVHCRPADGRCVDCYACFRRALRPQRQWTLRSFGSGLLDSEPAPPFMTAFILLLLTSVLYDGALATPEWARLESGAAALAPGAGELPSLALKTIGLVVFWMALFGAYAAVAMLMSRAAAGRLSAWSMARTFAPTLVPIAIAYHLAHYLGFLLLQGQYILPLVSDPFGYRWDLFGTAGYRVDIALVGARFAWFAAVTAIVLGHIAAVYRAHQQAMGALPGRGAAIRSQIPLTALMVAYTMISLSILAEPIVERSGTARPIGAASATIAVPDDALLAEPGSGRLRAVGPGKLARQRLTYRVLASAFHDGTRMGAADILYAYSFAYRWGVQHDAESGHYDPVVAAATAPIREHLSGLRIVGTDTASKSFRFGDLNVVRELLVIEVYTSIPPGEPEQDAAVAPPWSTLPWHLIVLMEEAVNRDWAAFSQVEAGRRGVEWLDLARSERLKPRLAELVDTFGREGYRPEALRSLVSVDEARQRWAALGAFYKEHGHFLVANGPYQLKRWGADRVELEAFRDLSYPLGVGSYDAYALPRHAYIAKVERQSRGLRLLVDVDTIQKFQRSYKIVREPLQSARRDALSRIAAECRYVIIDAEGRVARAGLAPMTADAAFELDFDRKLPDGAYTVLLEATVNGNAMNAEIKRLSVVLPLEQD